MPLSQDTKLSKPGIAFKTKPKNSSQDVGTFFSSISPWILFVLIIVCCIIVVGIGAAIGYMRYKSGIREPESPIETAVAAIFGLLAFMLGFTFSVTWSKFASRNSLIISQAKAIEACFLLTSILPEEQQNEIRKLLYDYTKVLLNINAPLGLDESLLQIETLHSLIWQQTASLTPDKNLDGDLKSLFMSSINDMFGYVLERKTIALEFRIPDMIWFALLLLAGMGMFVFGYQTGINGIRRIFGMTYLPIAFGLVIVLIADLNSTGKQRSFKVTKKPLSDVLEHMDKEMALIVN